MLTSNLTNTSNLSSGHLNHPVVSSLDQPLKPNRTFDEARKYFNQNKEANQLPASSKFDLAACHFLSPDLLSDYSNPQLIDVSGELAESMHIGVLQLASTAWDATNDSHLDYSDKTELEYRKRNELSQSRRYLDMIDSINQTGRAHEKLGNFDEALRHFEKSLELSRQAWPGDHVNIKATLNRINSIHDRQEARRKL